MRVQIFGIGSPAGDDQAGWLVADTLRAAGVGSDRVVIEKLDRPGALLVSLLEQSAHVVLIDAMQGGGSVGTILRFDQSSWPEYRQGLSSHGFGVFAALSLGHALGSLPRRLDLYGIEIASGCPGEPPGAAARAAASGLAGQIAMMVRGAVG